MSTFRTIVCLLLRTLVLLAVSSSVQAMPIVKDDFNRYPDGSDAAAAWDAGAVGWSVQSGTLESEGANRSLAIPLKAPQARRLVVEAAVRARRAVGAEWKTAGIAVVRDDGHYWHLAFVEQPDRQGRRHSFELTEMYGGRWLANYEGETKLTIGADRGMEFAWEYDHPYRLRIELTQDGIAGKVLETDGTERAHRAYRFDRPAVTSGRPALFTSSLAATFDDFHADIRQIAPPLPKPTFPPYANPSPGAIKGRKTGFFHVERLNGRWWIVDPAGRSFYAVGTDHVNYNAHWCEKLGYAPYSRNVQRKFGREEKWAASAVGRLKRWGFNTLGAGHSPSTRHRGLAHTEFMSLGANFTAVSDIAPRTTWTGFPDVFHPGFARWCEQEARRLCGPHRGDPWLLGYFLDNELEWFGKNGSETGLVDEVCKKPENHPAKQALVTFLRERYPSIASLNRAWGTGVESWEALARSVEPVMTQTPAGLKDRRDFVLRIADRYFALTAAAVRKADPDHMVLGSRFAGIAPPGVVGAAGRHCDIVSVNYYGQVDLERGLSTDMPQAMRRYYAEAKRPLMITEWSFPALDAGLPSQHGAGQRVPTQKDKARCYRIYQKTLFSLPFMVGSDYFMWVDEPALGISSTFPEDSNYGLVDVNDDAWHELTKAAERVNPMAHRLHAGDTAELSADILGPLVRLRNAGRRAARFTARLWVQGKQTDHVVTLSAGARRDLNLGLSGPSLVSVVLDPNEAVIETDRSDNAVDKVVMAGRTPRPAVVVANPSAHDMADVPVSISPGRMGTGWTVRSADGRALPAQVDDLPDGPELAFRVPRLPARAVVVLPLVKGAAMRSRHQTSGDRAVNLPGVLRLEHNSSSGDFFDRVSLDGLTLGRFRAVIHQAGAQSLWVAPDRVTAIETWEGPARTILVITAGMEAGNTATTAVNPAGIYARQERRPNRFRVTHRLTRWNGEAWFTARFLRLQNTDTEAWRCAAYYHYPLSFINGDAADDRPGGTGSVPFWHDEKAGAAYGAVVDTARLRAMFWKDTPDGPGEHPDIWREVNTILAPGQVLNARPDEPEVRVFGERGRVSSSGGPTRTRIRDLSRVKATLLSR